MIKSPRFIRPHKIIVKNKLDEIEGNAQYHSTTINHVSVDTKYGIKQSQKGIEPDGTTKIVIDLNDLVAFEGMKRRSYVDPIEFGDLVDIEKVFTIAPDDLLLFKGKEYTVNSITEVSQTEIVPCFLEIIANE